MNHRLNLVQVLTRGIAFGTVLALVAAFAVGCNKGDGSDKATAQKKSLHVFSWSDYFSDEAISQFEASHNADVIIDTYENNEDLVAKLQAGVSGYDIIVPSDYAVEQLITLALLEPLDKANIPNFSSLDAAFLNQYFDPNNVYSIPYVWGTAGIGYDSSVITDAPTSWAILWDAKYKNNINMLDDMRETLAVALKRLGYSVNTTDPAELAKARDLLIQQKPLIRSYTTETDDLMQSGQVVLTHAWSGDVLRVSAESPNWKYVVPSEGSTFFIDNIAIPKGAKNKALAESFINHILQPQIIATVTAFTQYGNAVAASEAFFPENLKGNPAVFPSAEVRARLETLRELGDADVMYGEAWTAVKAAN